MSKQQRALQTLIDECLEICRLRGIGPDELHRAVHAAFTFNVRSSDPYHAECTARAHEVTAAGMARQIVFLKKVWGIKKLKAFLETTGGVLDAIARATSSTPDQLAIDNGRDRIDVNGDVM